jgi:hypothetical protein
MTREAQIPLFLWIATAVVVHAVSGGGVDKVATMLGETLDIRDFAASVRRQVKGAGKPIEVAFVEDEQAPEETAPDPNAEPEEPKDPEEVSPDEASAKDETDTQKKKPETKLEEKKPDPPKKEEEKKPEPKKEEEKKPDPVPAEVKDLPPPEPQRRIAVKQHVDDPNQKDNPEAEFLADQANRVKEQTQARITSTDQDDPKPNPGTSASQGPPDKPGNADVDKVAQSDDHDGDPNRAPGEKQDPTQDQAKAAQTPAPNAPPAPKVAGVERRQEGAAQGAPDSQKPTPLPGQAGQRAQQASRAQEAAPDPLAAQNGSWAVPGQREASVDQEARKAKKRRALPPPRSNGRTDMFGLGAPGSSPGGVNLNLSPTTATATIGEDRLYRERVADGQRRRSAHRGSWKSGSIERWRSAIENYVPSVKPGNQTALNAARSPFASYLNLVHNRLHPIFADQFLGSLDELPGSHPLNGTELVTHLEIVLDREEGRIQRMGVTRTSGVTAFDVAALSAVDRAQPFGAPPREIVSPDGNVYFHWEFFRNPQYACSTYFAHPFILKTAPKPAPGPAPSPSEPPVKEYEPPAAGERHGSLDTDHDGPG